MAKTYVTKQGDTWDSIAYNELGDEYYMTELMALNYEHRMTVIFSSGITLQLPEVTQTQLQNDTNLPPWKRK